jgi:Concanavalin A-like lectin/glucanases superfamily
MRRTLIAAVMAAGCSYREPTVGPGSGDDTGPDAPGNVPHSCPSDGSLRLCVDFDSVPAVIDGMSHTVQAMNVTSATRLGDAAAHVDTSSQMFIAPADAGDLDNVTKLTIEMWIAPDHHPSAGQTYWMLDNNTEYGIEYLDDGKIRCVMGPHTVDSVNSVATGSTFVHLACTYDMSRLIVLVDGAVDNCVDENHAIPTGGHDGVAIGANLGAGPVFNNRFVGGLDNVRVYNRKLTSDEICMIAGHGTSCSHSCPDGGDD